MFDEKTIKSAFAAKDFKIEEMFRKEKDRMARSIREAPKYFVDPEKRNFVSKSWGWEDWLANSELYCGKRLFVKKGKKCSWHYHQKKDETFSVISGRVHLFYSEDDDINSACEIILTPGDAFHVPPGLRHQFKGLADSELVEFSTQHFDDDTVRL